MYKLKKKYKFCAAHSLKDTKSLVSKKCLNYHGHLWQVQIEIEAEELVDDMIIDFGVIKKIIDKLDHQDLNKILDFNPTAENISKYLYEKMEKELYRIGIDHNLKVTIEESPGAKVSYYKLSKYYE